MPSTVLLTANTETVYGIAHLDLKTEWCHRSCQHVCILISGVFYYPDRKWQHVPDGMTYTFTRDGTPQIDARNNVYYMAAGNSPSMMEKNVGQGSQYLWTYRDVDGNFLDGSKTYRLHILPKIPANNFWSVVVYDALSRSELQNGQPFPSISSYTKPTINGDGSIDIIFGPQEPKQKGKPDPDRSRQGLVPIFRFYGPAGVRTFDKTWKLEDIVVMKWRNWVCLTPDAYGWSKRTFAAVRLTIWIGNPALQRLGQARDNQFAGEYQIGDVYARSWTGTSAPPDASFIP